MGAIIYNKFFWKNTIFGNMVEPFTIAGLSVVLVINAIQVFLSILKRIKRSSCVNSDGAGINVEFESKSGRKDGDDDSDDGGRRPKHKSV